MEFAALTAWVLAAAVGGYLLVVWMANGGRSTKVTRFPILVVVGHPLAAVAGLAAWIAYLFTGTAWYAWGAFAALLVVAFQGFMLFTRWLVGRGGRHARGAEQAFPATAVAVHGAVAAVTVVLVFLTVIVQAR
ncbi:MULTISPECIES: hypothetical protein [Actinomadura]|uniref:Integral membrane protein n=1 Tax=Actinomadura litoris TaxID=2678616 RepID=A0A7K1KW85_9ACTN|nr:MULTISPECIES: hypothetical protein [Actinomadura]MBT2211387.1 hypothetical protein [Actinomadura sp. NEAU-AAG7]MUN36303.1 hypothetical protein [Actinomadura litoris]